MQPVTDTLLGGRRRYAAGDRHPVAGHRLHVLPATRHGSNFRLSAENCRLLRSAGSTLGEAVSARDGGRVYAGSESREARDGSRHGPAGGAGRGGRAHRHGGDRAAGAVALLQRSSSPRYCRGISTRARGGGRLSPQGADEPTPSTRETRSPADLDLVGQKTPLRLGGGESGSLRKYSRSSRW